MNSSTSSLAGAPISRARPTGRQLASALGICGGAGVLAAPLICWLGTRSWYGSLIKPVWALLPWALALFQLLAFVALGASLGVLWASGAPTPRKRVVLSWLWTQFVLGVLWNFCFFGLHSAGSGYAVILLWWCALVGLLWTASKLSRAAFWALVPLFVWVTFASSLNFAVLSFNVLRSESAQMDADPRNANSPAEPSIITKKR